MFELSMKSQKLSNAWPGWHPLIPVTEGAKQAWGGAIKLKVLGHGRNQIERRESAMSNIYSEFNKKPMYPVDTTIRFKIE